MTRPLVPSLVIVGDYLEFLCDAAFDAGVAGDNEAADVWEAIYAAYGGLYRLIEQRAGVRFAADVETFMKVGREDA